MFKKRVFGLLLTPTQLVFISYYSSTPKVHSCIESYSILQVQVKNQELFALKTTFGVVHLQTLGQQAQEWQNMIVKQSL